MAGHSKWANIQFRKGAQDAKRGKLFTKLLREVTVAARMGGPDPDANPRLRTALEKARTNDVPKDNIERAVKRGSGLDGAADMEEIRYEGYGPAGVAVIVDCLSDNKNRAVSGVRHAFSKSGGNLGTTGSVAYLFSKVGLILFAVGTDEDQVMEIAIDAGADDVQVLESGHLEVSTTMAHFLSVKDALENAGLAPEQAELTMIASNEVVLDKDDAEKLMRLVDMLEDLDDVQNVYTNAEISSDILEALQQQ